MLELEQYLEGLVHRLCADLANIYPGVGPASTHGLIFPTKRGGSLRISEQEAKLLFFQHLTLDRKFFFSVETPTVETYRQKGMTPMSARVDLTLYDSDRKVQPAFKSVGIAGVGWHTFRHTVGTMLAEMGEHQLTIRDYLRHSNLHVTNKYLQATSKTKRSAQEKLVEAIMPTAGFLPKPTPVQ